MTRRAMLSIVTWTLLVVPLAQAWGQAASPATL